MPLHSLPSAETGEKVPERLFIVCRRSEERVVSSRMDLPGLHCVQVHVVKDVGLEVRPEAG